MKTVLMVVGMFVCSSCLALQQNSINAKIDKHRRQLDLQCQQDMTAWCVSEYRMLELQRKQELNNLEPETPRIRASDQTSVCATKIIDGQEVVSCH